MHIIDIFCILLYILNCIFCVLYILHILHIEHIHLHIACVRPWLCPRAIHIMHIFWHIMHIVLHIYWHIRSMAFFAYSAYLLTYRFYNFHIMHICTGHILHILHILCTRLISVSFVVYFHYCLAPHLRAQLFTYHHLHPLSLFWLLSQEAPGKSADSLCMSKGYYPFLTH